MINWTSLCISYRKHCNSRLVISRLLDATCYNIIHSYLFLYTLYSDQNIHIITPSFSIVHSAVYVEECVHCTIQYTQSSYYTECDDEKVMRYFLHWLSISWPHGRVSHARNRLPTSLHSTALEHTHDLCMCGVYQNLEMLIIHIYI